MLSYVTSRGLSTTALFAIQYLYRETPQNKPMDLYLLKEGQKGDFKIAIQICADEWISLTCFYCLSIVFLSLGKRCLIRPDLQKNKNMKCMGL